MKLLFVQLLFALMVLNVKDSVSQIPRACNDASSLMNLRCCPSTVDGMCGRDAGRGACVTLQFPHNMSSTDVRNNWPHYFTQACQCNGNFSGYDCSRCKFGYYGPNCDQYQVLPRKPVANFTDADWTRFNEILSLTRTFDSGYVAILEETAPGTTSLNTANLTLYGMFVWLHHYAAKDSTMAGALPPDYAHTAPGFNTWHRLLCLWLEWEIQGMLNSMSDPEYYMFRLPYWDWRREIQLSSVGLKAEDLFTINRFGATRNDSGLARVYGDLYGNGWDTLCWRRLGQICDPRENTGLLQRCPFTGTNPCSSSNPDWPSSADINNILNIDNYDSFPYNRLSTSGYRANVDFTTNVLSRDECRNDRQCLCIPSLNPNCETLGEITSKGGPHVVGHVIIGQGDLNFFLNNNVEAVGAFEDIAASPNDPVFILHHNMIDCILIEWLRLHPGTEYPRGVLTPGHARDGYIIPFFPLFTNNEIFVAPEELGYTCNLPGLSPADSGSKVLSVSLITMLVGCLYALLPFLTCTL